MLLSICSHCCSNWISSCKYTWTNIAFCIQPELGKRIPITPKQKSRRKEKLVQKSEYRKLWGNVSIFLFGDIMQLKPVQAKYIFEKPSNQVFHQEFYSGQHWNSFQCILLEQNHRQNEDKTYADMLNRFRIGKQTQDDLNALQTRVRKENHNDLKDAMFLSCTNKKVKSFNEEQLSKLPGITHIFEAKNMHPSIKDYMPHIGNKGQINETNFMQTLLVKLESRIQLIHNIDVGDCLTNGTRGTVKAFIENKTGDVETIMVKFDEEHQGKETRSKNPALAHRFKGLTPIRKMTYTYSISKKSNNRSAKLLQFPLR